MAANFEVDQMQFDSRCDFVHIQSQLEKCSNKQA